ncbi:MAG: tripartite tricarboxylate transporter substrate binding protein [Beijerinckiaceae bacterium]|nr:tripartite tricarboxylate transporter substrate binding protein [Beijerinckiaceae bacterium]
MRKWTSGIAAIVLSLAMGATSALAQGGIYRIIVPFAPGGGQDVLARVIAPELSRLLGNTYIVENRAGAGGAVGGLAVARSAPDGSTLLMAASGLSIAAAVNANIQYDPVKDFTHVAHVGSGAYLLLSSAKVPAKTTAELIAYAKANPGKLNYASAGAGSATHLGAAFFTSRAGMDVVHVPFKSSGEALNSVLTNETQFIIVPTLGSQAYVENPDIRVLAAVSKTRLPALPNVPTISESALPGFEFLSWFGLLGPANMPADVTEKINAAVVKIIAQPDIAAKIDQQGIEPKAMTPEEFTRSVADNFEVIKKIAAISGLGPK